MDSIIAGVVSSAPDSRAARGLGSVSSASFKRFQSEIDKLARNGVNISECRRSKLFDACIACLVSPVAIDQQKRLAGVTLSSWAKYQPQCVTSDVLSVYRRSHSTQATNGSNFAALFGSAMCTHSLAAGHDLLLAIKFTCTPQEWNTVTRAVSCVISIFFRDVRTSPVGIPIVLMQFLAWILVEFPELRVHIPDSSALRYACVHSVVSLISDTYPLKHGSTENAQLSDPGHLGTVRSSSIDDIDTAHCHALAVIGKLLSGVWATFNFDTLPAELNLIMQLLISIKYEDHTAYIAWLLAFMPAEKITQVTQMLTRSQEFSDEELVSITCCFVCWVSLDASPLMEISDSVIYSYPKDTPPLTYTLWGSRMLQSLSETQRGIVLARVTERTALWLTQCLSTPRPKSQHMSTLLLLNQLLSGYQNSPKVFLSIASLLPDLMEGMQQKLNTAGVLAVVLSRIVRLMLHIHGKSSVPGEVLARLEEAIAPFPVIPEKELIVIQQRNLHKHSASSELVSRSTGAHLRSEFRRGLLNLGNTCYINSVVQGMLSIGVFVQSIFRTPVKTKGSASMECMKLFAFLHESARSAINPQTFVNTCRPPWFTPGTQQDASEFWVYLLDCLEREEEHDTPTRVSVLASGACGGSSRGHSTPDTDSGCAPAEEHSSASSSMLRIDFSEEQTQTVDVLPGRVTDDTPSDPVLPPDGTIPMGRQHLTPSKCFHGQLQTISRCGACGLESRRTDVFNQISLAFSDEVLEGYSTRDSVEDMLQRYLGVEILEGKNQYECNKCGLQKGSRKFTLKRVPPCLVLTLNYFKYNPETGNRSKLLADVTLPLVLNVPVLCSSARESTNAIHSTDDEKIILKRYHLNAVIVHRGGSPNSGHYYTYGSTGSTTKWCVFNDSVVQAASQDALLSSANVTKATPYMLMYVSDDAEQKTLSPLTSVSPAISAIIQADNVLYERELSQRNVAVSSSTSNLPSQHQSYPRSDDDDESHGSSGFGSSLSYIM